MIVYNKNDGFIIANLDDTQDINIYYRNMPKAFIDNLAVVFFLKYPHNLHEYKILDEQFVPMSKDELREAELYGRFLTEAERLIEQLKPSYEEIKKAEQTIEILSLLQEVM